MTFAWGGPDRDVIAVIPRWIDGFGGALLDDDDDVDVAVYRVLDEMKKRLAKSLELRSSTSLNLIDGR
jgi:hypothetical protein